MEKRSIDIFNYCALVIRNIFLVHNADVPIIRDLLINKPFHFRKTEFFSYFQYPLIALPCQ